MQSSIYMVPLCFYCVLNNAAFCIVWHVSHAGYGTVKCFAGHIFELAVIDIQVSQPHGSQNIKILKACMVCACEPLQCMCRPSYIKQGVRHAKPPTTSE